MNDRSKKRTTIKFAQTILALVIVTVALGVAGGGSLAAAVSSALPAEDGLGTLTIHKFYAERYENLKEGTGSAQDAAAIPEDAQRVADVVFKVEKLLVAAGSAPSIDAPIDPAFDVITDATDADGQIRLADLPKGFYRVTELTPKGQKALNERFLVKIPLESGAVGQLQWNWDVHVFPKNTKDDDIVDPTLHVIVITKLDRDSGARLSGAVFKIAPDKTAAAQGRYFQRGGVDIEVATATDGTARIEVPKQATYYLVETAAPKGYIGSRAPIEVTPSQMTHGDQIPVTVYNTAEKSGIGSFVPKTGDQLLLSVAAFLCAALIASGACVVLAKRNEKRRD